MTNPDGDKENPVADPKLQPSTRLYVILARKAAMGVVFRRGPSKHVLLINWNTEKHEFRMGQWLNGRIYERRCDLLTLRANPCATPTARASLNAAEQI